VGGYLIRLEKANVVGSNPNQIDSGNIYRCPSMGFGTVRSGVASLAPTLTLSHSTIVNDTI